MATWHVVLYSAAAILALRSFIQLVTNYRNEFEHVAVRDHLTKMADELQARKTKGESASEPESPKRKQAAAA
ncbi:MAG: hypothetical protein HQ518_22170 [Rhodopirellula sp.]|nr:hypothetical protein [Rhodopirellula sp.]